MSYGLIDLAMDAITGGIQYAEQIVVDQRVSMCNNCEFKKHSSFDKIGQCGKCGCYISHKTKYNQSSCPDNRW